MALRDSAPARALERARGPSPPSPASAEPSHDQNVWYAEGAYSNRDAEESLAHWEEQRENNVEFLRGLDAKLLERTGRHTVLGQFTLSNLLNEWALHDLGHLRQLSELVRAQLYYPELGPFQVEYLLKP